MSAVQDALDLAKISDEDTEGLMEKYGSLKETFKNTFAFERDLRRRLEEEIFDVEKRLSSTRYTETFGRALPVLSTEVLKWRNDEEIDGVPVPKLAMIGFDSSFMHLSMFRNGRGKDSCWSDSNFDFRSFDQYDDVHSALETIVRGRRNRRASLTYAFSGAIPNGWRETINLGVQRFGWENVKLLAEAPTEMWSFEVSKVSYRGAMRERVDLYTDPIIVAHVNGQFLVLGHFDPTPVEQYILDEFTK